MVSYKPLLSLFIILECKNSIHSNVITQFGSKAVLCFVVICIGLWSLQGEAPGFLLDELQKGFSNGFDLKSNGCDATTIVVGNKTV